MMENMLGAHSQGTISDLNYPRVFWAHRRFLSFGLLAAWVCSFGQTFFPAFFNPEIRAYFDLTHCEFGALYAVATLISRK